MTKAYCLTDAQIRAVGWLPPDGSWTIQSPGSRFVSAVNSLALFRKDLMECEWGNFGQRGGKCLRRRLTAYGMDLRRAFDATSSQTNPELNNEGTV